MLCLLEDPLRISVEGLDKLTAYLIGRSGTRMRRVPGCALPPGRPTTGQCGRSPGRTRNSVR